MSPSSSSGASSGMRCCLAAAAAAPRLHCAAAMAATTSGSAVCRLTPCQASAPESPGPAPVASTPAWWKDGPVIRDMVPAVLRSCRDVLAGVCKVLIVLRPDTGASWAA
eukprot:CAMPEP_0202914842 /NCGR_PEP_ID=MMETSP1392-20130828/64190_1 /ASSEMBLY_ACC=CAM_ASM_000868 /TAXON_ID=225041 /ORGANISM="Chlamydomonas chlamydogama, Strain SAG 11-48b" /LENGTH=108 /DNA_ID=CAMNT_0049606659 /DNA_START=23 /DNA_END=346 /DNA_ORIENTATION=-